MGGVWCSRLWYVCASVGGATVCGVGVWCVWGVCVYVVSEGGGVYMCVVTVSVWIIVVVEMR